MRDRIPELRERGAALVVVGSGAPHFAAAFREDQRLPADLLLLVDPTLRAYRAAGLRRGRVEALSPRLPLNALRALRSGYRQGAVQGDPWQLGGVFVIRPGGALAYRHVSREAGDHAPIGEILDALEGERPLAEEHRTPGWQRWLGRGLSALADPTVALSFDRTGFRIHALTFHPEDLEVELGGRRCLVTGANSGIGFETALALADLGADVVLLCRRPEAGREAAEAIRARTGSRSVTAETLDVSQLAAVREVGDRLAAAGPVDVLVHNAGVLPAERGETPEGLELTWATHVVGPHLLTKRLRPALERSRDGRVIWVSSGGMYTRKLQLDDPNWRKRRRAYDGVTAYAETKRAQVVLAELWAEELGDTAVVVNAMHPGWADTPSVRSSIPGFYLVTRAILRTPAEGADTVVWLAAAERAREHSGRFFFDRTPRHTHWLPWTRESEADRGELWHLVQAAAEKTPRGAKTRSR